MRNWRLSIFVVISLFTALIRLQPVAADESGPMIEARAWGLMDATTGAIVAGSNLEQAFAPASITKLMTTFVIFDAIEQGRMSLTDQVTISEAAWRMEGSRMFAELNSVVTIEQLLKSTIIQSGNDAAVALAEHASGSEARFAVEMNRHAKALGMVNSKFANASGLPADDHYMSPADIMTLASAIIRRFPEYYQWYSTREFEHNGIRQFNRNKLLWKNIGVDGLKTGHTEEAGYCLVASATRDGERWISVVMGTESERAREREVSKLLDYGFNQFRTIEVLDQQDGVASADVYGGALDSVRLKPSVPVNVTVPVDRVDDLVIDLQVAPDQQAPIQIGQAMGLASVYLDDKLITDVPLVAMSAIEEGGFFKQLWDALRRSMLSE